MIDFKDFIQEKVVEVLKNEYAWIVDKDQVLINHTKQEFEGDYTIVLFPFMKEIKKSPGEIGQTIGDYLIKETKEIESIQIVKGFLNLVFSGEFWIQQLDDMLAEKHFGHRGPMGKKILIEFSSPNTNKPLHLGHIRNILLGWSCAKLKEANGYEVVKTQIVNDRGIAICKSMVAWQKYGNNRTPDTSEIKGDHFVGDYYVLFEKKFQEEYAKWQKTAEARKLLERKGIGPEEEPAYFKKFKNQYFNEQSDLGQEAISMLRKWEANDKETMRLWWSMNRWVYDGFRETYKKLGVHFDKDYYESQTYLLGKKVVEEGLNKDLFYRKEDQSVWVNLKDKGLDEKLLLRKDGTSVYVTQDLGTADLRYSEHNPQEMIYVVADEQDYHFQVLFAVMEKLGRPFAACLHHLSYGMIDLPEGKMKSREGTVVDADELIAEVLQEAREAAGERGELAELGEEEQKAIIHQIGMAALKYFIIKVNAKKRMIFNPRESVDLQGQTGPYIQNAYVRIRSIMRRKSEFDSAGAGEYRPGADETELIRDILDYPNVVLSSGNTLDPSGLANYCYQLAKGFHKFYHDFRILNAETDTARDFRLRLSEAVAYVLKDGMELLGIEMPERM